MAPIRKGDGTALNLNGIEEVRTGDGRVFFEGGDAIPDSAVAHYDATALNLNNGDPVDPFVDQIDGRDLPAVAEPTYQTNEFGGDANAVFYDGTDDAHQQSYAETFAQPVTYYIAVDITGDSSRAIISGNQNRMLVEPRPDDNELLFADEDVVFVEDPDAGQKGQQVITAVFDGENSFIRVNQNEFAVTLGGANELDGVTLGGTQDEISRRLQGHIGEVVVDPKRPDSTEIGEQESRLAEKFGISF